MTVQMARIIRVFVSSPGDVAEERKVLSEIVDSINRTDGQVGGFRLELFRWEDDVVPQIGPKPQQVVDGQMVAYDIYLGIMSTRFGTPAGRYGSGTEKEYKDALKNWKEAGAPWITFYFNDQPTLSSNPADVEQYLKVCQFRQRMQKQGLYATYKGVRGSSEGFYEKVSMHLRRIARLLQPLPEERAEMVPQKKGTPHSKVKILFLASMPDDQTRLRLDKEFREIDARIRASKYRDDLELVSAWAVRARDLQEVLLREQPQIVHFSGHGSKSEELCLEDDAGKTQAVSKAALTGLFRILKDNVRIVVLNACYSRPQAKAITEVIDFAVGMKRAIGDKAAIEFASAFYQALGYRRSVQTAFELGCNALQLQGIPEEDTPDLLVRHGADSAHAVSDQSPLDGRTRSEKQADPTAYLQDLAAKTGFIDIRGLHSGKGKAYRFPIEELYISLTTTGTPGGDLIDGKGKRGRRGAGLEGELVHNRPVPLHETLSHDRLVITGDPGSGKTTFLRRVVHTLCDTRLDRNSHAAEDRLALHDRTFPMFIRMSDLAQHLKRQNDQPAAPAGGEPSAWLPQYLGALGEANSWGLDEEFFRRQLEEGCTVLFDGLDEAPDRVTRERLSRLVENVTRTFSRSRFVITSRPAAYTGGVVLPDFTHARIDPLSDGAVEAFLKRWCAAAYAESESAANEHCDELLSAVRGRPEIRRLARNPVMLTALAVVHWNERRLPEQRADLYHSIITWLSRSREQRPGRETADRTVVLLSEVALAMQAHAEERKTQAPRRWAAEQIAARFGGKRAKDSIALAEAFLAEEEVDSGILVGRANDVSFWHLTFQEFLAAKAIAAELDEEQRRILFANPSRIYQPEWHEVVVLLSGILHEHGQAKVDGFVRAVIDQLGNSANLAEQARCVGLLGCVVRDLTPLKYQITDLRYEGLLQGVMGIFDPKRFHSVPVEIRIAAGDALGQAGDVRLDFSHTDYWVRIPAGKFVMGAQNSEPDGPHFDEEADDDESPVHEVYLDAFRIARYPITVSQYRQFLSDEGYQNERWWNSGGFGQFSEPESWSDQLPYPSRPVVGVSWFEAAAYCRWAGVRLPTEAEWERAARGTEGRKYPWGHEEPDKLRTNFAPDWKPAVGHPTPVGIFPLDTTPERILDMGGNVLEWCRDWFAEYAGEHLTNPCGPEEATGRVFRGGSWHFDAWSCRAAFRFGIEPVSRYVFLGFRVAAVPQVGQVK